LKILICCGTRPEAIKMVPILKELNDRKMNFKLCITAQHREMLDQVLDFFNIIPDYDLSLMKPGQSLNSLSAAILNSIDQVFEEYLPNLVLVQGDTTSASVIALAAFNRSISVGHVEAGLRTYNKKSPFPEEGNRQIISKIADYHFVPTKEAYCNLKNEGLNIGSIIYTGNTVVDALNWAKQIASQNPPDVELKSLQNRLKSDKNLILVTGHRRESFGNGIKNICQAILDISLRDDVEILYPVHLNPEVNLPVRKMLDAKANIHLVPPVSYPSMLWLLENSTLIISDSGGIQEEAPSFNKPVLVTREITERMEGVKEGFSILTGTDTIKIVAETERILDASLDLTHKKNPYGDGRAAFRIVEFITSLNLD
jgi:UDP-N-acetylglucosamine 2-epimerase (non-hydrolysing)